MPKISANGINLYYESEGDGTPMVLAHAYPMSHRMWRPQVEHFSRRFRVITYDARGMGGSDAPYDASAYSQPMAVEDLRQLLRALGVTKAVVGGLSMGGNVALNFGLAHPETCAALLIADTGAGSDDPPEHVVRVGRYAEAARAGGIGGFMRHIMGLPMFGDFVTQRPEFMLLFREIVSQHQPHGVGYVATQTISPRPPIYALEEKLKQLRAPTLVIVGERDEPCVKVSHYMAQTIPDAELLVVPNAGHFTNLEATELFNGTVEEFLRRRVGDEAGNE